jgi:hypothetical protein
MQARHCRGAYQAVAADREGERPRFGGSGGASGSGSGRGRRLGIARKVTPFSSQSVADGVLRFMDLFNVIPESDSGATDDERRERREP